MVMRCRTGTVPKAVSGTVLDATHRKRAALHPGQEIYTCRSTIFFLISAIDFAGLSPFGQAFEQFMMVWQR